MWMYRYFFWVYSYFVFKCGFVGGGGGCIYFLIAENSNSPKWGCIGVVFERQNTTTRIYYCSNLMACFDMIDEEFDVAHPFPVRLNPECHVTGLCDQLNTMTLNSNL